MEEGKWKSVHLTIPFSIFHFPFSISFLYSPALRIVRMAVPATFPSTLIIIRIT